MLSSADTLDKMAAVQAHFAHDGVQIMKDMEICELDQELMVHSGLDRYIFRFRY